MNFESSQQYFEYKNYNMIDWDGINSTISSFDTRDFFGSSDVDFQCSLISPLITSLFDFVPLVRQRIPSSIDNWMRSNRIVLAMSLRDLAFSALRLSRSDEDWKLYCRYRNRAKNIIRKLKDIFLNFFSGLDSGDM